jgi:hypothetical protein
MRKLLLIFVFLLVFQVDILATMNTFGFYGSISYSDQDVNSPTIIIDTPLFVSGFWNINNDGYWQWKNTVSDSNARPIPEFATMFLLGIGLITLGGVGRKKLFKDKSL